MYCKQFTPSIFGIFYEGNCRMGYEPYNAGRLKDIVHKRATGKAQVGRVGTAGHNVGHIVPIHVFVATGSEKAINKGRQISEDGIKISVHGRYLSNDEKNTLMIDYHTHVGGYRRKTRRRSKRCRTRKN